MPTTKEQLEAQRLIEQKRASDKALLKAGVRPKLRIVGGRQHGSDFDSAFSRALKDYEAMPRCPECNNEKPPWGGPYCDCPIGQSALAIHRQIAGQQKSREQERCAERRKELSQRLQKAGGFIIPEKYKAFTPKTLKKLVGQTEYDKYKKPMITIVWDWINGKLEKPGLLISGEYGVGKSALCLWAVRYRVSQTNETPLLIRYRQFIDVVQDCYRKDSKGRKLDFIAGAQQAEILMLDDFGQVNLPLGKEAKPDKQEIMLEVLDYRTQHGMATLIVTNLTQSRLMAQFNGAIIGRLMELCRFHEMGGINLRPKGAVGWQ